MAKVGKRTAAIASKIDRNKLYPVTEALALIKETATAKFDESIDVAVQLGIDPKKSDQLVRGSVVMPAGTGKTVRVAVFAQGEKAEQAKAAGADIVGLDDLAADIKAGNLNFDVVIASPDTMRVVGTLGQVLGPRGLMPNPKVGTVTPDVATAVKNAKAGQVQYRTDKAGIIHATIGRASFEVEKLQENLFALVDALNKARPAAAKGIYLRKLAVSSTMGGGAKVEVGSLSTSNS
ncbi:50S ribosomal protein L1 [Taylorella equigenitalis]|uniref:Large ribosomal subunit protein uL1 n=3 Tax=Taylorella equigenitalis TaxID=29575 RepID=A0A654KGJ5_TAYEM|nr:50S ribosomal protein L1 [Taylorella equigenitalis]ADU91551.1 LSU ribosomal protein L1p (L10Ae) [Taylorella equigenitalis MCE9]AFN36634.1 50S ribosomal protein L1 [Taylorella equigenitalis ATCC 35865]ASY31195.1 50S ribosomal protein L1 [Taylorella equigenitalis]ASY38494.1 50S ribosomal protein L1 [Taylorella equigenitalis]ASY40033.1 50S ribosomal protein L1 [Taylorella equigenitalis]